MKSRENQQTAERTWQKKRVGKASSERGLLPNRIWAVEAYTEGKTQLPRSHYPTVCREGSYLIVSGLSLGPPN